MSVLPSSEVLLLGPGPSPVSSRVRAALGAPSRSHLDPEFMAILDDVRAQLGRVFRAPAGSIVSAVSGTGTSGMETVVANLTETGMCVLVIVTGYFGERLAQMFERYGAAVVRLQVEWGRAVDPAAVATALRDGQFHAVGLVHVETSTGVVNPVAEIAALAHEHDAMCVLDAVTSLGAMPLDAAASGVDAAYSCSQKGLGAPSGLAPVMFAPGALARRVRCRSFYFDLELLEAYWVHRKYHHTMSAPLLFALHTALCETEEEGLEPRWQRHQRNHQQFVDGLAARGWSLLPEPAARAWSLNAVRIPAGADDAAVRRRLLAEHHIEIGAGLGPLAGKVWRVGLMGAGSTSANVDAVLTALSEVTR
jgi:alanine-glyoxylate transaminase / serine-glyoxylate transaminase / serine-pyruvate transaminase